MIYTSPHPNVPVVTENIYNHLFHNDPKQPELIGGLSGNIPAFIDAPSGATLTRRRAYELTSLLAYSLRNRPFFKDGSSLKRGDTVLIYSPNSIIFPIVVHAATCAGLRVTPANSAFTADELLYQLKDSSARLVFAHPASIPVVEEMNIPGLPIVSMDTEWLTGMEDGGVPIPLSVSSLIREAAGNLLLPEIFSGKDVHETVFLCYSSGTTGKPKGVEVRTSPVTSMC
jgi:4-coumarate--CoA ligase